MIKIFGKRILCVPKKKEKKERIIIQPDDSEFEENIFLVKMVGENNLKLIPDDEIIVMSPFSRPVTINGEKYCVFEEENVLAVKER